MLLQSAKQTLNIYTKYWLIAASLLVTCTASADEPATMLMHWIQNGYTDTAVQAEHLQQAVQHFCQQPQAETQKTAQTAWKAAMYSWMLMQPIRFGPVHEQNIDLKLFFWPDKKDTVKRSVENLLRQEVPTHAEKLTDYSAAGQGFPALEYLLFDKSAKPKNCIYMQALGENIAQQTQQLATQWQMMGALPDLWHELINSFAEQVKIMFSQKLGEPLGKKTQGISKPFFAESWRSQSSLAHLRANLHGLQQAYDNGLAQYISITLEQPDLSQSLQARTDKVLNVLDTIQSTFSEALDRERPKLEKLYFELEVLLRLHNQLAEAAGIQRGFNASDGD